MEINNVVRASRPLSSRGRDVRATLLAMTRIWNDIHYAFRMVRRKPAFAIFAVVTLAIGIGINTTVFSLMNVLLLRPLPVTRPGELIRLYQQTADSSLQQRLSYPDYQ